MNKFIKLSLFLLCLLTPSFIFAQPAPVGSQVIYNTASSGTFAPIVGGNYEISSTNLPGSATSGNILINYEAFCEISSCNVNTSLRPTVTHTLTGSVEECGYLDIAAWHIALNAVHLTSSGTEATKMDTNHGSPDLPQWYPRVLLAEFSGVATSSVCRSSGSNSGSGTTATVSTTGSCTSGDLVVGAFTLVNNSGTADSPYTSLINDGAQEQLIYHVATSTGVQTATMTQSSGAYYAVIGCFKPGGGGGGGTTHSIIGSGIIK